MLLATMLNYMDRQALAQQAKRISDELNLSNQDYARIESGFGLAFAVGGIVHRFVGRSNQPALAVSGRTAGLVGRGLRDRRGDDVSRALRLPGAPGIFRVGPMAVRARDLATSAVASGSPARQQHPPERGVDGRHPHPDCGDAACALRAVGGWRLPFRVIGASGAFWVVAWLATVRAS